MSEATTQYDCGLSNSNNFGYQRVQVWASDILEAIQIAEEQMPGYKVHHVDVIGGAGSGRKAEADAVERWIQSRKNGETA